MQSVTDGQLVEGAEENPREEKLEAAPLLLGTIHVSPKELWCLLQKQKKTA